MLKITKGVIGKIYPDDWMPVDEDGIRADLWVDMNSPVGRNNPGQLYESGINRISEFARRKIKETFEVKGSTPAFEMLMDWYGDVNPNYEQRIREVCVTNNDKKGIVKDAIETSPKIWIPPFLDTLTPSDEDFWNALQNIKKWQIKWGARSSRIRYKTLQADGSGKEFITEEKFAIGSKYILHLHKIPEITAPGPASVNHIGIPTKSNYDNKYFPVSNNPYRYGEDELRIMSMETDIREVVRFQNLMANSPTGVNAAIQSILLSEKPTCIKRIPISNGELLRTSAILRLFHNVTATLGIQTKVTKDDDYNQRLVEILDSSNELTESIWQTDIVDFGNKAVNMFEDDEVATKRSISKRSKVKKAIEAMEEMQEEYEEQEE